MCSFEYDTYNRYIKLVFITVYMAGFGSNKKGGEEFFFEKKGAKTFFSERIYNIRDILNSYYEL